MSRGQGNELLNKLEGAGLTDKLAQKVIDSKNNDLAVEAVRLIQNAGSQIEETASQVRARAIMGCNMFGIPEAAKHFKVAPSRHQLSMLEKIPFSEVTLQECKDTHILCAVFPFSVLDICRSLAPGECYADMWYAKQSFAKIKNDVRWMLIRRHPIEAPGDRNWWHPESLLGNREEPLALRTILYAAVGFHRVTGEELHDITFLCSDTDKRGDRVFAHFYEGGGHSKPSLFFSLGSGLRCYLMGLASARKPENM